MISDTEKYQGVVLRQLVVALPNGARIRPVNHQGRIDAFSLDSMAFLIKFSSLRVSPWRFTYTRDTFEELRHLSSTHSDVWVFHCCGPDGVFGLSLAELREVLGTLEDDDTRWVSAARSRSSMYRVAGSAGKLSRAKAMGVVAFCELLRTPESHSTP